MATAEHRPKGILKNSSSFEHGQTTQEDKKKKEPGMKWDEMNILATYHPADKDYGHMKIDEPSTPYNYDYDKVEDEDEELDPSRLANKLEDMDERRSPRVRTESEHSESDDENMTETDKAKHSAFVQKRRMHYNEFEAVKLARKLMEEDDEENEEVESDTNASQSKTKAAQNTTTTKDSNVNPTMPGQSNASQDEPEQKK